jgi:hypothetical protein
LKAIGTVEKGRCVAGKASDREIQLAGEAERFDQHHELLRRIENTAREGLGADQRLVVMQASIGQ